MSISAKINQLNEEEKLIWDNMKFVLQILTTTSEPEYSNGDVLYMIYAINNIHCHRVLLQDRKFSGCFLFLTRDMPALMQSFVHFITNKYSWEESSHNSRITRSMAAIHMKNVDHYRQIATDISKR